MQPEEARAVGRLAGDGAAMLTRQVGGVHAAIAGRVWDAIGPLGAPARLAHDGIAAGIYAGVATSLRLAARAASHAAALSLAPEASALGDQPGPRHALAVLNGAMGDALERQGSALATAMSLRVDGRTVPPAAPALHRAYPRATPRLVVFVHGLAQTEDAWTLRAGHHPPYGARLAAELGYTPLYVRYNTGRSTEVNGTDLATLLERVHDRWPVAVEEIAVVGHCAGGLVARHAIAAGRGRAWHGAARHLITLGTPHAGSGLADALGRASRLLGRLPETRPVAGLLEARSAGAKEFGRGSVAPFSPSVRHLFISGGLSRSATGPLARVGDALVSRASAWAQREDAPGFEFGVEHYRHIGGVGHFGLLNHPIVYMQIWAWLREQPALPAPRRRLDRWRGRPSGPAQRP